MAEPHVITALAKKRAELAGDIETAQARLRQMILDLESKASRKTMLEWCKISTILAGRNAP